MANEKRMIYADEIYDAVERRYQVSSGIEHRCERDLLDLICAAETVDAVEVVLCKDCQHYDSDPHCCLCTFHDTQMLPHNFCSYGEKRTDG